MELPIKNACTSRSYLFEWSCQLCIKYLRQACETACEIALYGKIQEILFFQEIFASIYKIFILRQRLGTGR